MTGNMKELEILTEKLVFTSIKQSGFFEIEAGDGKVIGFTLFKNEKICIARSFGEKNTLISFHSHPGKEWFGLYSGKVKIEVEGGDTYFLEEGQQVELPTDKQHRCLYLEPSWGWIITMPPDDFPEKM